MAGGTGIQRAETQEGCFRQGKGSLRGCGRSDWLIPAKNAAKKDPVTALRTE